MGLLNFKRKIRRQNWEDFSGGPVVKNLPCNAGDAGLISGQGGNTTCLGATKLMSHYWQVHVQQQKAPPDATNIPRASTKTQGSQLNKVNFQNTELLKKKKDDDDVKLLAITINLLVTQMVSRPAEFMEWGISKMKIKTPSEPNKLSLMEKSPHCPFSLVPSRTRKTIIKAQHEHFLNFWVSASTGEVRKHETSSVPMCRATFLVWHCARVSAGEHTAGP